jgi:hypothetical protein
LVLLVSSVGVVITHLHKSRGIKAMPYSERAQLCLEAITEHLKNVGSHDWEEVKKEFLDVSPASFWRHVQKAKAQLEQPAAPAISTDLFSQAAETVEEPEPWDKPRLNSRYRLLQHAERLHELHADILALRQQALDKDGKICDPQLFAKSIRLRNQLLMDELDVVDGTRAADANTDFFDTLIEEVSKASPEVAKAIMLALHAHNKEANGGEHNAKGNA